jgi:hypothetical protein
MIPTMIMLRRILIPCPAVSFQFKTMADATSGPDIPVRGEDEETAAMVTQSSADAYIRRAK